MDCVPAVAIRNLNFFYGEGDLRKQVLFDIHLQIAPGQIVIVTGPSGSGKTTLLTLLGALRTATMGSLQVLGQELVGLPPRELVAVRRRIGFIFQAHNLFASLTARQNVLLALDLHGQTVNRQERAAEMLTALGLRDRLDYLPQALSGGQKQRVAIARALVHRPQLVLADEPTAALDKQTGREVVALMQRLVKESGTTILMVTHDNRILDIADRLIELVDGTIERDREGIAKGEIFML